jgi:hypothetical protein
VTPVPPGADAARPAWLWLWPANAVGALVIVASAAVQPIVVLSAPCDGPDCDPHGYVAIFAGVPAAGVAIIAVVAVLLLASRSRVGFGTLLGAAAASAALLLWFAGLVPVEVWLPIACVTVAVAVLAFAGLRYAPTRVRVRPGLDEPPYPSLG